jgi:hypothetical protein
MTVYLIRVTVQLSFSVSVLGVPQCVICTNCLNGGIKTASTRAHKMRPLQRTHIMKDVAEDTTQFQNAVLVFCLQWSQKKA